ncbi:MAG: signal peptidase I [Verrucomicrobia bacterium]|nr:signal peptidase I [Verrucomicrobiota bacterium]
MGAGFWAMRKMRKAAKAMLHHARHTRAMREDVTSAASLADLASAEDRLRSAVSAGDVERFNEAANGLDAACRTVWPPRPFPSVRENVEILVVALGVAMALRCFFIQPFRIPTGSMQPTMFGVKIAKQTAPEWYDRFPVSWLGWAIFGEGYVEVRAKQNGYVEGAVPSPDGDSRIVRVSGLPHSIRLHMPQRVEVGAFVSNRQVLASGRVTIGDHVFVDKVRYNFSKPKRGNIIVFDTTKIPYPNLRGDFYIKRLVGLPTETISLRPPYLVADGKPVGEPFPFHRLVHDPNYNGYQFAGGSRLAGPGDTIQLGPDEYLPFGDNTGSSLDGRYFGPITRSALVGPAFMTYWPFSGRWGRVR